MVASAVFITDLSGKSIISRNYRGDVPLTKAIETFAKYLTDVEEESKKPVFYVDNNGDVLASEDVGCTGPGGETFVYVQVSTKSTRLLLATMPAGGIHLPWRFRLVHSLLFALSFLSTLSTA
jgi:hypothetical protein